MRTKITLINGLENIQAQNKTCHKILKLNQRAIWNMRNIWCPKYQECLDREALKNSSGWDCSGCQHKNNGESQLNTDFTEIWLLLWAIFKPDLYREYKEKEKRGTLDECENYDFFIE